MVPNQKAVTLCVCDLLFSFSCRSELRLVLFLLQQMNDDEVVLIRSERKVSALFPRQVQQQEKTTTGSSIFSAKKRTFATATASPDHQKDRTAITRSSADEQPLTSEENKHPLKHAILAPDPPFRPALLLFPSRV